MAPLGIRTLCPSERAARYRQSWGRSRAAIGRSPSAGRAHETAEPTAHIFHLRRGVRFHNGSEVTVEDVSLIESAKLCGVEPKAYLLHAVRAALANPGTVTIPHALLTN